MSKAWEIFARYIKLRDTNQYGYGRCIDTDLPIFYKRENGRWISNCDAGHYISREIKTLMYNEKNVHAQLSAANRKNIFTNYRKNLVSKVGEETVLWLETQKHQWGNKNYFDIDEQEIIEIYSEKVEYLLKKKMF